MLRLNSIRNGYNNNNTIRNITTPNTNNTSTIHNIPNNNHSSKPHPSPNSPHPNPHPSPHNNLVRLRIMLIPIPSQFSISHYAHQLPSSLTRLPLPTTISDPLPLIPVKPTSVTVEKLTKMVNKRLKTGPKLQYHCHLNSARFSPHPSPNSFISTVFPVLSVRYNTSHQNYLQFDVGW